MNKNKLTSNLLNYLAPIVLGFAGYALGLYDGNQKPTKTEFVPITTTQEIQFVELKGDTLYGKTTNTARIKIQNKIITEEKGNFQIPIASIPTQNDQLYYKFPFVGNNSTKKVYKSESYHGRGIAPENRRFFTTKTEAITHGFTLSSSLQKE